MTDPSPKNKRMGSIAALQAWSELKYGQAFSVSACHDLLNVLKDAQASAAPHLPANEWMNLHDHVAPENITLNTKIDDADGCRNEQTLMRRGNLWWYPDGSMYVYYRPTHWRYVEPIAPAPEAHVQGRPDGHCGDDAAWKEFVERYGKMSREGLVKGSMSDFALANAQFMCDRNSLDLIGYQTAVKDRIRWLSIQLAAALATAAEDENHG